MMGIYKAVVRRRTLGAQRTKCSVAKQLSRVPVILHL